MWTWETALLLYSTMIFAAKDLGSLILRFRNKKFFCRSFGLEDPVSIASEHPSHNNIFLKIFYRSTQPTKNLSELRSNGDRLS